MLGEETNPSARPEHNACVWFLMWFGNGDITGKKRELCNINHCTCPLETLGQLSATFWVKCKWVVIKK